jgi:hypothetical protein
MRLRLPLLSAILLGGCAAAPSDDTPSTAIDTARSHKSRERELQTTWRGKPYTALVAAYGEPKLIMNVPGYRPLKTSVAVFGIRDDTSRCIDAFTVVKHGTTGEWTVADYFCR